MPADTPPVSTVTKKPMPFWLKILLGLAVLALAIVSGGILFTEKLVDVVDKHIEALRKGDIDKAYSKYTSNEFKATTSLDQFQAFVDKHPILHNSQLSHFTQRLIKDHLVILKGKLTTSDHHEVPVEYRLIKENKGWKIQSVRILSPEEEDTPL